MPDLFYCVEKSYSGYFDDCTSGFELALGIGSSFFGDSR